LSVGLSVVYGLCLSDLNKETTLLYFTFIFELTYIFTSPSDPALLTTVYIMTNVCNDIITVSTVSK